MLDRWFLFWIPRNVFFDVRVSFFFSLFSGAQKWRASSLTPSLVPCVQLSVRVDFFGVRSRHHRAFHVTPLWKRWLFIIFRISERARLRSQHTRLASSAIYIFLFHSLSLISRTLHDERYSKSFGFHSWHDYVIWKKNVKKECGKNFRLVALPRAAQILHTRPHQREIIQASWRYDHRFRGTTYMRPSFSFESLYKVLKKARRFYDAVSSVQYSCVYIFYRFDAVAFKNNITTTQCIPWSGFKRSRNSHGTPNLRGQKCFAQ